MPKEMGGTLEQLGRMWEVVSGEGKWTLDRTGAPEGCLGEERGSHAWRDSQRLRESGVSVPSTYPAQSGHRKPAGLLGLVLHPPRLPPATWVLGA